MSQKKLLLILSPLLIIFIIKSSVIAQDKDRGFTLRQLFGISPKVEEIYINSHIQLKGLDEWAEESERFYRNRDYKPAWFDNASLNRHGEQLMEKLKSSWEEGLPEPAVYLAKVEDAMLKMHKRTAGKVSLAEIISNADVHLTQAYFDYASKMNSGLINPADLNIIWEILPDDTDLVESLEDALDGGNINRSLDRLKPQHEQYERLLEAFINLSEVKEKDGWPLPDSLPVLREGDAHPAVNRLKNYLMATGDLQAQDYRWVNEPGFDEKLTEAVKKFQYRHGLEQDGIVGRETLKQMNVPLDYRLDQIRLNIDRIRWYPEDFGENHIVINIPAFSFEYHRNGEIIQEMKVVVGQNENYTPVLEDTLSSIIFNPAWNVPNSIATQEIFPKMLEDSTFMERNSYSVLRDSYVSKDTIDYKNYDWPEASRDSFPYFVVQHPGPTNSLGRVQFMLQNQYSIFLHDTPANHLFNIEQRDFSHGCVRLERPAELAVSLLKEQLPADTIIKYLSEDEKQVVRLEENIPVHLIYQTAWIDEKNLLHFREDIYGFDELSMPIFIRRFPAMAVLNEN